MSPTPAMLAQRLQTCRHSGVVPETLLEIVERVARWQMDHPVAAEAVPAVTPTEAERHRQGVPLVPRAAFPAPADGAVRLKAVLDLVRGTAVDAAAAAVQQQLADGRLDPEAAVRAYLAGDESFFAPHAATTPEAPRLLPFALAAALTPWAVAVARSAVGEVDLTSPETVWTHGHCPVCGALPVMGELRDKEGHRIHTCSFCQTAFRVPRLHCPFCLETAHGQLGFLDAPELPGFRLHTCATCRMYIKVTDFRAMDRASWPAMDDLESMALDMAAMDQGWRRPTLSAWGF